MRLVDNLFSCWSNEVKKGNRLFMQGIGGATFMVGKLETRDAFSVWQVGADVFGSHNGSELIYACTVQKLTIQVCEQFTTNSSFSKFGKEMRAVHGGGYGTTISSFV